MPKELFTVITGGGSGIGKSLSELFAKKGHSVLIIGRTKSKLEETAHSNSKINFLVADISKAEDRKRIYEYLQDKEVEFLIHNAATLDPVGNILEVPEEKILESLSINLQAPLFLTRQLLPLMAKQARVFHVSSGAAYDYIEGWGSYCVSKAAFLMLFKILKCDLKKYNIAVGSAFPGIVDTPMQEHIRSFDSTQFPNVNFFRSLKEKGKLLSADIVAAAFYWLLTESKAEVFSEKDWDIKELLNFIQE